MFPILMSEAPASIQSLNPPGCSQVIMARYYTRKLFLVNASHQLTTILECSLVVCSLLSNHLVLNMLCEADEPESVQLYSNVFLLLISSSFLSEVSCYTLCSTMRRL